MAPWYDARLMVAEGGPAITGLRAVTFGTHGIAGPGAPAGANLAVLAVDTVFRCWRWNSGWLAEELISDARASLPSLPCRAVLWDVWVGEDVNCAWSVRVVLGSLR